jgi:hypothetical protein
MISGSWKALPAKALIVPSGSGSRSTPSPLDAPDQQIRNADARPARLIAFE